MPSDDFKKRNPHLYPAQPAPGDGVTSEFPLHEEIVSYCDSQRPRWKYIHARTDKKSTIGVGVCDFVLFLPNGKTACIECKSKTGKLSEAQLIWKKEMEMLGHTVHVIRSFQEFVVLTNKP